MMIEDVQLVTITEQEYNTLCDLAWMCKNQKIDWQDVLPLIVDEGDGATDGNIIIKVRKDGPLL